MHLYRSELPPAEEDAHVFVRMIEYAKQEQRTNALRLTFPEQFESQILGHFPGITHDFIARERDGTEHIVVHLKG